MKKNIIVVTGAGGFIGGHLVRSLYDDGYQKIRAVDSKPLSEWWQVHKFAENISMDLKLAENCQFVCNDASEVYNLAADMGGMGFIENNKALCMLSVLINTHMLIASKENGVERYFYSSSACVYNTEKQQSVAAKPLTESDAYPAMPEDGYGWEKLFSERMCKHFYEDFGLKTRVARYHNVYGPHGTWRGGREKAPAAICRKIIEAKLSGLNRIKVWGDGTQTRSFMYIDDCTHGTLAIMKSECTEPLNLGSDELVSINQLIELVEEIAGINVIKEYEINAPKGVNGRNSDNTKIISELGWSPSIRLIDGLSKTYEWIYDQVISLK